MNEKIIEKSTKGTLNQNEFFCKVDKDLNFNYVLLYVQSINKYLCWKKSSKIKKEKYNAQQKQVLKNKTDGISYFIKGEEFYARAKEKVYIISKEKITEFKERLLKDEVDFSC